MATVWLLGKLAEEVYLDNPVGIMGWSRHSEMPPMRRLTNFFGAAYFNARLKATVVAFRGSYESSDWTDADYDIARNQFPIDQLGDAFDWTGKVKTFARSLGYSAFYLAGHSLGGALVQVVTANISGTIGATYNAPGMKEARGSLKFRNFNQKIVNVRLAWDPVSAHGTHLGKVPIILDNGSKMPTNHKIGTLLRAIEQSGIGIRQVDLLV